MKQHNKVYLSLLIIPMVCCFSCRNNSTSTSSLTSETPVHEHTFANEYSSNSTSHWQAATCEHTELVRNFGSHSFVNGVCSVCQYVQEVEHVHTFSETYTYDSTSHWQAATCEHTYLTQNFGEHIFVNGYCEVCGMEEPEPEPEPHVHTFYEEYTSDDTSHWQEASCEHTNLTQNLGPHEYVDGVCSVCGHIDPQSIIIYDEEPDSTEGIDVTDLSHLSYAFSNIGENYTLTNQSHFNDIGLEQYVLDYKTLFSQKTTRMFNEKYLYAYSNDIDYSFLPDYNKVYLYKNGVTKVAYATEDLTTALSVDLEELDDDGESPFKLSNVNASYLSSHTFERVSKYKYICEEREVIDDFINLCCPYMHNEGYYMTYKKVSIELDNYDAITRIRIYASPTQTGKLTETYLNPEYTNWYLMFNETTVKDIGKTYLTCLE